MTRKSITIIIVVLLLALPIIEYSRERVVYSQKSQSLESAYQSINLGMSKEQVKTFAGEPHSTWKNELGEVWYWSARNYQGALLEWTGLVTTKGHFDMSLIFDESGKVSNRYGGIN